MQHRDTLVLGLVSVLDPEPPGDEPEDPGPPDGWDEDEDGEEEAHTDDQSQGSTRSRSRTRARSSSRAAGGQPSPSSDPSFEGSFQSGKDPQPPAGLCAKNCSWPLPAPTRQYGLCPAMVRRTSRLVTVSPWLRLSMSTVIATLEHPG